MKQFKIEIQVTILTICIAVAVIVSGYFAYQSLSGIVDTIHKEARPDLKLLLIKDISSDLNEVENTIRLYSLTGNTTFLKPYRQLDSSIQEKLGTLSGYVVSGSEEYLHIDSISQLANRKLIIWDEIRALHYSKKDAHNTFSKLYSRIDTAIIQPDTIRFKPEEKKGFFKRIFAKKDTTTKHPIIIDKTKEKEIIKKEIAGLEEQITTQTRQLQAKEKFLLEQNIRITQDLNKHIATIESSEQTRLENKTAEADAMAAQTYSRMAMFTIAAVILLIIILILLFRNLQKNRTYQQALKKAKNEAENLTKAKEMFVATVSHEMRTPVNAIYGLTRQMLQKSNSNEMNADLNVVNKSAEHLIALVNDTLDFSKIESQKLKIEQVDFLPGEILSEVLILHKETAQKKGIELIINNALHENHALKGDPIRLRQILINLVTNAIKFTDHGKITLDVSGVEIPEQGFLLNLVIADTGMGISKEDLPFIFDEFVQLGTDLRQKQRGAGLGLSIVKKLVILQNGKIEVDSEPGKGTRFTIQIPYAIGNIANINKPGEEKLQIPKWLSKLHFLIVDDEEYNLHLIRNTLNSWGVTFTEASNGEKAVELAEKKAYDLILMDIRMPVMDGYEAAKLILQHRSSSKIIALTATTNPSDIQKIELAGMHAFLQKPFAESDLLHTILNVIQENSGEFNELSVDENTYIDLNELERILGSDPVFLKEMLNIFIRSSEDALAKFHRNLENKNWSEISETAHKLAAPARHLQADNLYNHLKKLETISDNSNTREIKDMITLVEMEINTINTVLKQKLQEL
jgi:signal transduction histidine kinase/CheY-like chemotaxis protein/HPt (histidine-containing phosphotransfer) domain-containing protein